MRHIYVQQLVASNFAKWRKFQTRIMFKHSYSFFQYYLLYCRYVMFQKRFLSKPKRGGGGGHKQSLGGHGLPWPHVAMVLVNSVDLFRVSIPDL